MNSAQVHALSKSSLTGKIRQILSPKLKRKIGRYDTVQRTRLVN